MDYIVSLCKENDIEILFYIAPYQGEYQYGSAMKNYATDKGYKYLDLFEKVDEMGIDSSGDFSDEGHLNRTGAEKLAMYVGDFIIKNYELTDMRTVDNNLWIR